MSDKNAIIKEIDLLVDEYHTQALALPRLIEVRRHLAIFSYSLASHVKQTYGNAGLKYIQRKYRIAEHIVDARNLDAKAPISLLEMSASKLPSVVSAQQEEVMAEAEKEELIARLRALNNVLNSLQQEIADLRSEKSNPSYQEQH